MPLSEKRKETMYKYAKNNIKRIPLDVQKEKYEEIKAAAAATGEKTNGYIKKAIDERMEREKSYFTAPTPEKSQPEIILKPYPNTIKEKTSSIKTFTPDAHKVIDLKRLSNDIRYQLEIGDTYGTDVLANLLSEARSIQESAIQENGGTATNE